MKKLLFSFVAAFIAAVMAFRCAELGEPMPVVLVAAALIGALAEYVLWSFFPDKRRVSRYKRTR